MQVDLQCGEVRRRRRVVGVGTVEPSGETVSQWGMGQVVIPQATTLALYLRGAFFRGGLGDLQQNRT